MIVLPPGKTAWSASTISWPNRRNLQDANSNSSINTKDVLQSYVSVQSVLPAWCFFVGETDISVCAVCVVS